MFAATLPLSALPCDRRLSNGCNFVTLDIVSKVLLWIIVSDISVGYKYRYNYFKRHSKIMYIFQSKLLTGLNQLTLSKSVITLFVIIVYIYLYKKKLKTNFNIC